MSDNKIGNGINSLMGLKKNVGGNSASDQNLSKYAEINIDLIDACEYQPRTIFDQDELQNLSDSIKEMGIIQPLVVVRRGDRFELIAGERRLRASKIAGLKIVPVNIKDENKQSISLLSLIENVQRKDLNCIEIARQYKRIIEEFKLSYEEVAKKVGSNKSNVANYVRLLSMPNEVIQQILDHNISLGHAKILAGIKDEDLLKSVILEVISGSISVRALESLITTKKNESSPVVIEDSVSLGNSPGESETANDEQLNTMESNQHLLNADEKTVNPAKEIATEVLGFQYKISQKMNVDQSSGRLFIEFTSEDELSEILEKLRN